MVAAVVVAAAFAAVAATTWLISRADASEARCEALARHIRSQLDAPPAARPPEPRRPRR
jgi:hypothetical protein